MLKTRVLTAIALLLLLLGMVFLAGAAPWAVFAAVIALASCWEWSRLCGFRAGSKGLYLLLSGAIAGALAVLYLRGPAGVFANVAQASFVASAYFWIFAVPLWLGLQLRPEPWVGGLAGWIAIWPMWSAFVVLREAGPWLLLGVAALVWVADIAAYFVGRRFGRRKLAPSISPGKTWEGVAGALLGVLAYGAALFAWARTHPGAGAALLESPGAWLTALAMLALTVLSVQGDLFESWMKRGAGRKDSSGLLPGHGGVLDRVDALMPVLPVAALLLTFA